MNLPSVRTDRATARRRSRGQVVVIFAGAMLAFIGLMAIVIDISWYWASSLRVQRAADAAALAGVVWLPSQYSKADSTARDEATKNGYTNGVDGVVITTQQDPVNDRRLIVNISAPIPTFFARVIGVTSFTARRSSFAEFVLPVPMGSPENYYGTFGLIRGATLTASTSVRSQTDTGWLDASAWPSGGWSNEYRADSNNNGQYAQSPRADASAASRAQQWASFGINFTGTGVTIDGIEVQMRERLSNIPFRGNTSGCQISTELSWNGGSTWTTPIRTDSTVNTSEALLTIGTTADLWGRSWTTGDFTNPNLRLRLTWTRSGTNSTCPDAGVIQLDTLEVRVTYTSTVTGTNTSAPADVTQTGPGSPCDNLVANCFKADDGAPINPRGFWASMNTEGASNINGDAFQPFYDCHSDYACGSGYNPGPTVVATACPSATQACYDPTNYYNYAIEMPPGSTGGRVYVFDPGFCETNTDAGTGERWFNGNSSVSSFYDIYNTQNTLYTLADDTLVKGSGTTFTGMDGYDTTMVLDSRGNPTSLPSGDSQCKQTGSGVGAYGDYRDYHNSWYLLNPSNLLTGASGTGTIYRLHTTNTDALNPNGQKNTNGQQSFSIYASATGGTPKVYGLGAMQMFTPLAANDGQTASSEFYLAQVPSVHAGKTMEIRLWDPGDTTPLAASLQIEQPSTTIGVWNPINFDWSAIHGTTDGLSSCNGTDHPNVGFVNTSTPSSNFNGCWLTIDVAIPNTYTAPQQGWWKIKYTMTGTDPRQVPNVSNDVTTWTAAILGNPVHLVLP